ncbi:uncharacterized protein GVI51_J08349 [Nakaseomyces glabratus]|uniref:Uncharacterized protein n=1 Tax=Candida glabrata (strain ATCC 2001 / BCRC 20586 / JCM 3761 / NBRC 0622 / NRRL Y-65 / CBS 138) TaxID=284593 RepID=Q6FNW6_CANGA|nr:uncharacterized protein CAGL0J08481g [Nakaseomyces glabratus]KAH7598497.1 Multicopper oxidases signature 1 [Nakaseomyces glabratus]KAH7604786.1 Multicopper oxidases signature 1 [Nakaseomyces glabratus]QHS67732.1 uncharacterized protein GVI51_J08349 [Nakaseomyces glabratus]CAG61029.1 unnamed protein product [Nakaseomyces glabratus]|eukprot:XP_448078.1 uncharacterized protein CAGL0J08481g [[Candida] glabrata]
MLMYFWFLVNLYVCVASTTHELVFNVASATNRDGRRIISINGRRNTYGPQIRVKSGDTINLKVVNNICSAEELVSMETDEQLREYCHTALHFHGLIGIGNELDGVPGITQDPIAPGEEFWYNITIPETICGTYWYHSHSSVQYGDGLRGVLLVDCDRYHTYLDRILATIDGDPSVLDTNGVMTLSDAKKKLRTGMTEQIITLSDWYNSWNLDINSKIVLSPDGTRDPRLDDSLINGKRSTFQVIDIPESTKYALIRFVNSGMSGTQIVNFPNHKIVVFETDGVLIKPYVLDTLSMAVGQRYSVVVVKGENEALQMINGCNKMMGYYAKQAWLASKHVAGTLTAETSIPRINSLPGLDKLEKYRDFQPVEDEVKGLEVAEKANTTVELSYDYYRDPEIQEKYGTGMFLLNGKALSDYFKEPIELPEGKGNVVDIVLNSVEHMRHPWHLHGHRFQVISIGKGGEGKFDSREAQQKYREDMEYWETHPEQSPMFRDSINLPGRSFVVLRIRTSEPGDWLLHCHVDWHVSKGLGAMFRVKGNAKSDPTTEEATEYANPIKHNKTKVLLIYISIMVCVDILMYYTIMR